MEAAIERELRRERVHLLLGRLRGVAELRVRVDVAGVFEHRVQGLAVAVQVAQDEVRHKARSAQRGARSSFATNYRVPLRCAR